MNGASWCQADPASFRHIPGPRNAVEAMAGLRFQALPEFGPDFLLLSVIAGGKRVLKLRERVESCGRGRTGVGNGLLGAVIGMLCAANLAACGTMTDQSAASAFTAPGKFDVYACRDMDIRAKELHRRQAELEQLMGRTEQSAGGTFVNAIAYRTEYLQVRGELEEMSKAVNDKQCSTESKWSSGRTVY